MKNPSYWKLVLPLLVTGLGTGACGDDKTAESGPDGGVPTAGASADDDGASADDDAASADDDAASADDDAASADDDAAGADDDGASADDDAAGADDDAASADDDAAMMDAGVSNPDAGDAPDYSAYPSDGVLRFLAVDRSGVFDEGAAEIVDFHASSRHVFVVDANAAHVRVLTMSQSGALSASATLDPAADIGDFAADVTTSVAVGGELVAVAVAAKDATAAGRVAFYDATTLEFVSSVVVGVLPDMLTFVAGRSAVVVACEGEQARDDNDRILSDAPGSITIVDVSMPEAPLAYDLGFGAFDARIEELRAKGVRIPNLASDFFADGTGEITVSGDLEPEYVAVSPDGTQAFVSLQENNAFAVVALPEDLSAASIVDIVPLGLKDHARGRPVLKTFTVTERPVLGTVTPTGAATGQDILLGGFSGLWFSASESTESRKIFYTIPDRGPNGDPSDINTTHDGDERPHVLPGYAAVIRRLVLDEEAETLVVDEAGDIPLMRPDGVTPISGRPNDPQLDSSEFPVDAEGHALPYDAFGGDFEGLLIDPTDDSFWLCDEYRPAIYNFQADGVMLSRFVPAGTAAAALGSPAAGAYGTETLPAQYRNRRANRGFEAIALDTDNQVVYAFIQTPLANPDRAASDASSVIRMLGIDADKTHSTFGQPVHEYVYLLEAPSLRQSKVDKIGDATYVGDGKFLVVERDSSFEPTAKKSVFEVDLKGASDVLAGEFAGGTLEQHSPEQLAAEGIRPVNKLKLFNPPSLGYVAGDKLEGLALMDDGRIALLNDNDFGLAPEALPGDGTIVLATEHTEEVLGIVSFEGGYSLDASDKDDEVHLQDWNVYGQYMPDGVASYRAADGRTYYLSANEGDSRDYDESRLADLDLDDGVFPGEATLLQDEQLGRLQCSMLDGDLDGDGDYDRIYAYGARSVTLWDAFGNLVWDSGDLFEAIAREEEPNGFNSDNDDNQSFDSRSDAKGPEPESVVVGTVGDKSYAFVGLERVGGVVVLDITEPSAPQYVAWVNPRNFAADAESEAAGDLGPEGLKFVPAEVSPTGTPLLLVANEVSGTTTVFEVHL